MQIPIYQINVNAGRRETDPKAVQKLADSISKVGLLKNFGSLYSQRKRNW